MMATPHIWVDRSFRRGKVKRKSLSRKGFFECSLVNYHPGTQYVCIPGLW